MGQGQGSISVNQKAPIIPAPPTPGPPFAINSADNGLSVDPVTGEIVLGQAIAEPGDPSQLLSDREIPVNGFSFTMRDLANPIFILSPTAGLYYAAMGDIGSVSNQGQIVITHNQTVFIASAGANYMAAEFNTANRAVTLGDIGNFGNLSKLTIDDANTSLVYREFGSRYLDIDIFSNIFSLGDIDVVGNGLGLQLDNAAATIFLGSSLFLSGLVINFPLGGYGLGNLSGTNIFIDDALQTVTLAASNGLILSGDTTLIHTTTPWANGAGALLGTLANSPAAGDPSKWIPVDDNGTTRYIPAW